MNTLHFPELPSYFTVEVVKTGLPTYTTLNGNTYTDSKEGENVKCVVHSKIHVNKTATMPHTWSEGFIQAHPNRWRGDILSYIIRAYGLKQQPLAYA